MMPYVQSRPPLTFGDPSIHRAAVPSTFDRLTHAEARRALYIDFEGEKDRVPALLGVHRRGRGARPYVHHDIIIEAFASTEPDAATTALARAVRKLLQRAESNDRRIVAWSEHELKVIRRDLAHEPELIRRFEARFANARRIAIKWRNRCHEGTKPPTGSLPDYLTLLAYRVPDDAVGGDVGATLRAIRLRHEQGRLPTPGQVERWERVIEHNRHDCIGMRQLCLVATDEMDALDAAKSSAKQPTPPGTAP